MENQYSRVVPERRQSAGARSLSREVYELREFFEWRGLGSIDQFRACRIRETYARFDAERKFAVPHRQGRRSDGLPMRRSAEGRIKPWQCKVFGAHARRKRRSAR